MNTKRTTTWAVVLSWLATALSGSALWAGPVGLIDDFSDADLSDYTFTKVLDQGAMTTNISFSSPSGVLQASSSGTTGAEQVLFFRNDGYSLGVAEELQVDSAMTTAISGGQAADLGIAIGATPTPGVRSNFLFISFRGLTQLNSRGFIGSTEVGQVQAFGVTADKLFIARPAADMIELGYYTGNTRTVMTTRNIGLNVSIADHVGFYSDLRADGALYSGLDNLRIVPEPGTWLLTLLAAVGAWSGRRSIRR